jgi:hypothetical protein
VPRRSVLAPVTEPKEVTYECAPMVALWRRRRRRRRRRRKQAFVFNDTKIVTTVISPKLEP